MELPNYLRSLPESALDILRYLNATDERLAGIEAICSDLDLSERGFGKAIRRLVTKSYVVMDGNQIYRLTSQGQDAAEELAEYEADAPDDVYYGDEVDSIQHTRRLVLLLPRQLQAQMPTQVTVGISPLADQLLPVDMVSRLTVLNGEPETPQEVTFELTEAAARHTFTITPGSATPARIKVEMYQLGPNPEDIVVAGGMYVDVDVTHDVTGDDLAVFGTDIAVEEPE
jgi:predicted transcriptional regulator